MPVQVNPAIRVCRVIPTPNRPVKGEILTRFEVIVSLWPPCFVRVKLLHEAQLLNR